MTDHPMVKMITINVVLFTATSQMRYIKINRSHYWLYRGTVSIVTWGLYVRMSLRINRCVLFFIESGLTSFLFEVWHR